MPIESLHMICYMSLIVTLVLQCTDNEIQPFEIWMTLIQRVKVTESQYNNSDHGLKKHVSGSTASFIISLCISNGECLRSTWPSQRSQWPSIHTDGRLLGDFSVAIIWHPTMHWWKNMPCYKIQFFMKHLITVTLRMRSRSKFTYFLEVHFMRILSYTFLNCSSENLSPGTCWSLHWI